MDKTAHEQFLNDLRSALHYLYDFDQLRRSPLAEKFGIADRVDTPALLQRLLIETIETMKPDEEEPSQSDAWMVYELLFFRFIRGYDRDTVANQLGFSPRQLSREQRSAIETLAVHLWSKMPSQAPQPQIVESPVDRKEAPDWNKSLPPEKPGSLAQAAQSVIDLTAPLAVQHQVQVKFHQVNQAYDRLIPQSALRHGMLNVLDVLIPWVNGGVIEVTTLVAEQSIMLCCAAQVPGPLAPLDLEHPNLVMAQNLLVNAGGFLRVSANENGISACLTLPTLEKVPVLVVDDNTDVIQLFQRYVDGTRYSITGVEHPGEALAAIKRHRPRIVVLDVMMPGIDGWDIMTMLRQSPISEQVPVIICSILPLGGLARSLGAEDFLQKPVLPENFIKALDQQMARLQSES